MFYVAALCVAGSNRIAPISQSNLPGIDAEFNYDFDFRIETVNVHRFVILRICDVTYAVEPCRAHATRIRHLPFRGSLDLRQRPLQVRN